MINITSPNVLPTPAFTAFNKVSGCIPNARPANNATINKERNGTDLFISKKYL
jgi:hypothetical protein